MALAVRAPSAPLPLPPAEAAQARLEESIRQRMELYRSNALDALHDLAMMPISANSAQNQVKLLAASKLWSVTGNDEAKGEIDATLKALNDAYQASAPRIKSIRERVVNFEE